MHPDIPMRPDIARLDLSNRRRGLIGYCLGMAVYTLAVVAMYPAFKTSSSLDKLIASDSTAAALFGISGSISTSSGWLNGNIYANFFPLVMLLLTIGYGAACLAGQDEDGTSGCSRSSRSAAASSWRTRPPRWRHRPPRSRRRSRCSWSSGGRSS